MTFALDGDSGHLTSTGEIDRQRPVDWDLERDVSRDDQAQAVHPLAREGSEGAAAVRGRGRRSPVWAAVGDEVDARAEARDHRRGARGHHLAIRKEGREDQGSGE